MRYVLKRILKKLRVKNFSPQTKVLTESSMPDAYHLKA
jgi:hypothetical protein